MFMATAKKYCITYIDDNGNEQFIEIPAYSEEQAKFILGMDNAKIIDIECTVRKLAVG